MNQPRPFYVYLDQNILGYVRDGKIPLERVEGAVWVYSDEHFNEIARGEDTGTLEALENLGARKLYVEQDEQRRFTGKAYILEYTSVKELFHQHILAVNSPGFDEQPSLELLAGLFGAENQNEINKVPGKIRGQVEKLLSSESPMNKLQLDYSDSEWDFEQFIYNEMSQVERLEVMREALGTHSGRAGNVDDKDVIRNIWSLVSNSCPDVDIDEFFGFAPRFTGDYDQWPRYLGIIGCHTVLNFLGYRTDKGLTKPERLNNILSDGVHIANASFCDVVLSEDRRFCDKASAIYSYIGAKTEVVSFQLKTS